MIVNQNAYSANPYAWLARRQVQEKQEVQPVSKSSRTDSATDQPGHREWWA